MSKLDYILGAVAVLAITLFAISDTHWSSLALSIMAGAIFVVFVYQPFKKRCHTCGHFYFLSIYGRLTNAKRRRCEACRKASEQNKNRNSVAA